jgi:hypothetical protein
VTFKNDLTFYRGLRFFFFFLSLSLLLTITTFDQNTYNKIAMSTYHFDYGPDPAPLQASNQFDHCLDSTMLQADSERTNTSELSVSSTRTWRLQLEDDFQPSKYSVICGRGKASYDHAGNHRLRNLASMFVENYSLTDCKQYKSTIASHIVATTREMGGRFCKYEQGAWFEVGDHFARGKVSAMFRDMLHTQYRSSAKAKTTRRRVQIKRKRTTKTQQYRQQLICGTGHLDDSSTPSSECSESTTDSLGFDYSLDLDFFDIDVF